MLVLLLVLLLESVLAVKCFGAGLCLGEMMFPWALLPLPIYYPVILYPVLDLLLHLLGRLPSCWILTAW